MDQIYNHIRLLSRQQDDGGWTGDGTTPPGSDSQDVDGGQELLKLLHDPFSGAVRMRYPLSITGQAFTY